MLNPEVKCKFCHHKISIDDDPDIKKETLLEASTIMTTHLKHQHDITKGKWKLLQQWIQIILQNGYKCQASPCYMY